MLLEIVESGFDAIHEEHRTSALGNNSEGWAIQLDLIGRYVTARAVGLTAFDAAPVFDALADPLGVLGPAW